MSLNKVLVIDIETTGLDPYRDEILMAGVYDGEKYTCCRSKEGLLTQLHNNHDAEIIGHNFAFDVRFLLVHGWLDKHPEKMGCTQLMAHTWTTKVSQEYLDNYEIKRKELNKTLPKGTTHREARGLSLKVLAPYFLRVDPFWETPGNHDNVEYNRKDCEYTYRLYKLMRERMSEQEISFYENRMIPWSKMLLDATLQGVCISPVALDTAHAEYSALERDLSLKLDEHWAEAHAAYREMQILALNTKYQEMAAKACEKTKSPMKVAARYNNLLINATSKIEQKINYDSPKQMLWLLKEHLGLNVAKIDDEDEESTGKAVLNQLASQGREDIKVFLEWRKAQKILTSFLPTYRDLAVDWRLHPTFNATGTRTGRTSSSKPNLQQVPPSLYKLFVASPGYEFIMYDLSGIEAALIALYSDDRTLYDILNSGISIHDFNTKVLFDLPEPVEKIKELYPRQRQTVKNVGFACFYGAGYRRIETVFKTAGFMISSQDAKKKLQSLKDSYPDVFKFHKEITGVFEEREPVQNLLGRPLAIPDPRDAYMKGFNTLIQSSASDLNLQAGYRAAKRWEKAGLDARNVLFIHDFIGAEARVRDSADAERILVDSMTDFDLTCKWGKINLKVEGGRGQEWKK